MLMSLEIAQTLYKNYPEKFRVDKIIFLLGSAATLARLKSGDAPARIIMDWQPELEAFRKMREKYLIYP